MKKIYLVLLLLLQTIPFFGQTDITTKITLEHSEIFGTKISMIAPSDFSRATNFLGFQHEETNSSIMALDFPTSFEKVSNGLNKENFEKQGVIVKSFDSIIFNGLAGYFISGTQTAYGSEFSKYILVFGTATETIMINGAAPVDDLLLSESVKIALLSAVYDANKVLTPLDAVDFKIAVDGTDFTFSESMSNMLIYKKTTDDLESKGRIVIAKSISKSDIVDKKEFAVNRMKGLPMQVNKILSTKNLVINDLEAYEVVAEGVNRKSGSKEFAFLTIIFNHLDNYVLYGSFFTDVDINTQELRKIAKTFQLK